MVVRRWSKRSVRFSFTSCVWNNYDFKVSCVSSECYTFTSASGWDAWKCNIWQHLMSRNKTGLRIMFIFWKYAKTSAKPWILECYCGGFSFVWDKSCDSGPTCYSYQISPGILLLLFSSSFYYPCTSSLVSTMGCINKVDLDWPDWGGDLWIKE